MERFVFASNKEVDEKLYDRWVLHHTDMSFENFKAEVFKGKKNAINKVEKKEFIEDKENFEHMTAVGGFQLPPIPKKETN